MSTTTEWTNAYDRRTKEFCVVQLRVDDTEDADWWYFDGNSGSRHEYDDIVKLPQTIDLGEWRNNTLAPLLIHMYGEIDSLKMKLRATSVTANAAFSRSGSSRCV